MTIKEALEKRFDAVKSLEQHRDKFDGSSQWEERWDEINKEVDKYGRFCDTEARMQEVRDAMAEDSVKANDVHSFEVRNGLRDPKKQQATVQDLDTAIQGWAQFRKFRTTDYTARAAGERVGIDITADEIDIPMREFRAMSTTGDGTDYIPQGFRQSLEVAMKAIGSARVYSGSLNTDTGNSLPMPLVTDTVNTATILNEAASMTASGQETDDPNTEAVTSTVVKFNSGVVRVSSELLQDSAFDLGSQLGRLLGTRIRRGQNSYFTTGTGSSQPQGHITGSLLGSDAQGTQQSAGATAITYEDIINLIHAVDPDYRPGAQFVMNDAIVATVRKIRDEAGSTTLSGQPMWQESMRVGQPSTLFGIPVFINQNMDSTITADDETISYGNHREYFLIRDAGSIRMRMLTELYADTDQVGFVAFLRSDSRCLWTSNWEEYPIKVLQQA